MTATRSDYLDRPRVAPVDDRMRTLYRSPYLATGHPYLGSPD
jgi:hypothetical protein